jgi:hypothetical protein
VNTVGFADLVDRRDVGMIERRARPRFSEEPLAMLRLLREVGREHLEGDVAR